MKMQLIGHFIDMWKSVVHTPSYTKNWTKANLKYKAELKSNWSLRRAGWGLCDEEVCVMRRFVWWGGLSDEEVCVMRRLTRAVCVQAGMVSGASGEKLVIALEPECASVWCRKLPPDGFIAEASQKSSISQSPGTRYVVVDCGGEEQVFYEEDTKHSKQLN